MDILCYSVNEDIIIMELLQQKQNIPNWC